MSMLKKVFGQNAQGEDGLTVFARHWRELRERDRERFADPIQLTPFGAMGKLGDYMATGIMGGAFGFMVGLAVAVAAGVPYNSDDRFNAGMDGAGYGAVLGMVACALLNPAIAAHKTYKEVKANTSPAEIPKP